MHTDKSSHEDALPDSVKSWVGDGLAAQPARRDLGGK
jgi:hypothetical protein